jgi:hypothetical protein
VKSVVEILVEVLTTPSESVQRSVSDCLPPLMQVQYQIQGISSCWPAFRRGLP